MNKKLLISAILLIACYSRLHAQQNDFPSLGDVRINTSKPGNHGGGYSAVWMPNFGALMPENASDYASIMLTSNVVRNLTTNNWGFADASMPAWKMQMGHGLNIDNFTITRSAPLNYSEQVLFRIDKAGNVGIGVAAPKNKLEVNGTIHSKSVLIDLNGWNDYVFKKEYRLPLLSEIKAYIDLNQHLPEIPSEQEMVKNGLDVSEMNKLLMKKIEELTLYVIMQDKSIEGLNSRMKRMETTLKKSNKKR